LESKYYKKTVSHTVQIIEGLANQGSYNSGPTVHP